MRTAPAIATTTRSRCCSRNLNTIADDNTAGGNDTNVNLLEAHYTHEFFDEAFSVTAGKAQFLLYLDGNAFANNERQQFVGKPFVNNSVLRQRERVRAAAGCGNQTDRVVPVVRGRHLDLATYVEGTPLAGHVQEQVRQCLRAPRSWAAS